MPAKQLPIEQILDQILTMLETAPSRIADITKGLTEAQLHTTPADGEWSANEVLAHLRSCADVWGDAIKTILEQEMPTIKAIDPRTWIKRTDYPQQEFRSSLQAFTTQRNELMAILKPLSPESWARTATVTGAGKPLQRTLLSFAHRMAIHERPHIKQIANAVKMVKDKA